MDFRRGRSRDLLALLAGAAQIAPHRQNDALIAWQSARKRTAEESLEAIPGTLGIMPFVGGLVSNIRARDTKRRAVRARHLAGHGLAPFGTVLATTSNSSEITVRVNMEVEGVAPYEAELKIVASKAPSVGDKLYVRVDPSDLLAVVADA